MTLAKWLEVPGNSDYHSELVKNERFKGLLEAIETEVGFETRPAETISSEIALTLHGRNTGCRRTMQLLKHPGTVVPKVDEVVANYQVVQSLISMGYEESEAKIIAEKYMEES